MTKHTLSSIDNAKNEARITELTQELLAQEGSLQKAYEELSEAQAIARIGRWELDLLSNKLHWSEGIFRLFELDSATFSASYEAFISYVHPDDRERVDVAYRESVSNKTHYEIEHRILLPDGRIKWVMEICRTEYDAEGKALRSIGTVQDITNRKNADAVLRFLAKTSSGTPTESFFESLARYLGLSLDMDFVCIDRLEGDGLSARTVAVWCDGHFEDNVSYTLKDTPCGDVVGKNVCCFPASVAQFFPRDQVLQDLKAESYVGVTVFGHTGLPIGLIAVIGRKLLANRSFAEYTLQLVATRVAGELERLEAEEALRDSEEKYRKLFSEMLDGYALHEIICDADGKPVDYRFLTINPIFERLTGMKAKDVDGHTVLELFPETEPYWIETYGKVALTGESTMFENYSAALGKHFEVKSFRPAPNQFACIVNDITDRKNAEAEKERLQVQLGQTQKMELVGQLAGGVAHDFNNLLTVILGYSSELSTDLPPDSQAQQDVQEIIKAGQRAKELTQQLLIFSRKQVIQTTVFDLNALILNLEKMLFRLLENDASVENSLSLQKALIKADYSHLEQLIINLALNARDAMPEGGIISIRTSLISSASGEANPFQLSSGKYVLLEVSDTGVGMDKALLNKIFEPFFTTKGKGKGLGLGLSTVYGIVIESEGSISVDTEPGKGTNFRIAFPYAGSEIDDNIKPQLQLNKMGKGEQILIVDDQPALSGLFQKLLNKLGYQVRVANGGTDALRIFEQEIKPDLLITDVVMPEMNGKQLVDQVLKLYPGQKVMFMSGFTDDIIAKHGIHELNVPFIQKPFSASEIAQQIAKILAGK